MQERETGTRCNPRQKSTVRRRQISTSYSIDIHVDYSTVYREMMQWSGPKRRGEKRERYGRAQ